jgi:hypothetical protein
MGSDYNYISTSWIEAQVLKVACKYQTVGSTCTDVFILAVGAATHTWSLDLHPLHTAVAISQRRC